MSHLLHPLKALTYSFAGLKVLATQKAFWWEAAYAAASLILLAVMGNSLIAYLVICGWILITFMTEALNTGLEVIADHLSPEWSVFAKNTKDLGSLAVLFALCGWTMSLSFFLLA